MKTYIFIFAIIIAGMSSCKKDDGVNPVSVGSEMFWTNSPITGTGINVIIDGGTYTGSITIDYNQAAAPGCGSNGCYTVLVPMGTHTFTATDGSHSWPAKDFTIDNSNYQHCNTQLLFY